MRKVLLWSQAAALALATACATEAPATSDSDDDDDDQETVDSDEDAVKKPSKDAGKDASKKDTAAGASSKADAGVGAGKETSTSGKASGSESASGGSIPCDVAKLVQTNCGACHGAKPVGAPFSLTTLAQFQGASNADPAVKMHEAAYTRVTSTDVKKRMPPASSKALSAADLKTLGDWLKGGAKAGEACAEGSTTPAADANAAVGMKGGSGGAHATKIEYDDPDTKCYPLTAFGKGGGEKYSVPTTPDLYVAFNLKAPWQGKQYVRSFESIIDNGEVLHHWLLFKQPAGGSASITENAIGAHPEGQMLYGWAPGGDNMWFDPDVGMEVDGSVLYQLEMHYNNKTGSAKPDASGVKVCVTPNKPAHVAGLTWVGTDAIAGTSATGRCAHGSQEPIHLISAQPHMHTKGIHMKVVNTKKNGQTKVIHDEPFDFQFQRSYIFDEIIDPGDVLNTTCTFNTTATFGKATNAEMCYFFTISWPVGALSSFGVGTLIHGANSCMDI